MHAGDELIVSRFDGPGLVVCPLNSKEELWIPASLIPNSSVSRPWSFRPRKIDSETEPEARLVREGHPVTEEDSDPGPPAILTIPSSIRAIAGGVARLSIEARRADLGMVSWRKEGEQRNIEAGGRYRIRRTASSLSLEIVACRASDSGVYHCRVEHDSSSCSAKIPLSVVGECTTTWKTDSEWERTDHSENGPANTSKTECCENRSRPSNSKEATESNDRNERKDGKEQAKSAYNVQSIRSSPRSEASTPVANSEEEIVGWEAEQFVGRYLELEELGVGRFARVRRARDRGTGQEVALKQTPRQKQSRSLTRAEYDFLTSTHHGNIVRAFALFENAPQPGIDTIVLELVKGSTLFAYLSEKNEYTEATVAKYAGQLLSALRWLHVRDKAHLDLKPENVLVDRETGLAKLIDLGEAVRAAPLDEVVPPADLEFAAPESVLGRPTGSYTDIWAAGVFIYVLLSGLSPFLDDSIEETTANILKCDFCFPDEYFQKISNDAKDLLGRLLCLRAEERATADLCLVSPWFQITVGATIPSSRMAAFIERRAHRTKSHKDPNASFYS